MVILLLYIGAILILLFFLFFMILYTLLLFYSSWMGSPYVPTRQKELEYILSISRLAKNKIFFDLGCGDGRVVRTAIKRYGVKGYGIDINPFVIKVAQLLATIQKIPCEFYVQNIFEADYSKADFIYLFLMPNFLKRLLPIFEKNLKNNVIVISHGFKLVGWESFLFRTIQHAPFPTYFYKFKKKYRAKT